MRSLLYIIVDKVWYIVAVVAILLVVAALAGGYKYGTHTADKSWRKECVRRGHATYIVNEDGSPKWTWNK